MRAVESELADTTLRPSAAMAMQRIWAWWPSAWWIRFPVTMSQMRTVLSQLPETSLVPSGVKATEHAGAVWPWSLLRSFREDTSQSVMVESQLPEASVWPSWLKASDMITPGSPSIVPRVCPVAASQKRRV